MTREFHMHLIFFPELFPIFWLNEYDRDLSFNIDQVRNYIRNMMQERRSNPNEQREDLLSILLLDPIF